MDKPIVYQIRVKGHLDEIWTTRFDGLIITNLETGEALLSGRLPDQAALYGVLYQINNLGLILISVNEVSESRWG
jgi:hypothetical protein